MSEAVLRLDGIRRTFVQGEARLEVLRGASVTLRAGEVVALVGPSGSGKSTLLQIAGLLERPDAGSIWIDGVACGNSSEAERTRTRRNKLGFVYQFHHLLPEFSALENVALPQRIAGRPWAAAKARAGELLERLGLGARLTHRPARLSGGEQQRVALARAVANEPLLLLADEPTGNLDQKTAGEVFAEMLALARGRGLAALIATHNDELAARMDRIVRLENGILVEG
jgi:lipoprotein-releasing system ATP-binding protein